MYTLPKLPYDVNALEPYIDGRTVEIHHGKHHQTYVNNLNKALEKYPELFEVPLEELLADLTKVPEDIRTAVKNNGGGHYNHSFYWQILKPGNDAKPTPVIGKAIDRDFGSFEEFKKAFTEAALTQFGSGYAWMVVTPKNKLKVIKTSNQDSPFGEGKPILVIDVWEHAYYLKYQNRRAEYIEMFFNIINWEQVEKFYLEVTK